MKKKIFLYIDSMQFGGAQRVINNIAGYLLKDDCSVTLINDILPSESEPEYVVDNGIQRYFLDEGNQSGRNKNLHRIKKLRRLIKKDKPDIVLSFLGPPNIRMLVAAIGLRCRTVVSVRNDPYREYGSGIKKHIARTVFMLADGCVFQTMDAAAYFPKAIQKKSQIIVNPVNEIFYNTFWTGEKKEIAVVGRLQPQKNPLLALEAFYLIEKEYPEYKIVFYGDEELKDDIIHRSKEFGIEEKVIIFGKTDNIEKKLEGSSVYLLTSDFEGMPNALLEAMAVGVPIVSTDCPCGGPRTVIRNEKQGILVQCGNAENIADALKKILVDRELQIVMHEEEKKRAEEFREKYVMEKWKEFLESV